MSRFVTDHCYSELRFIAFSIHVRIVITFLLGSMPVALLRRTVIFEKFGDLQKIGRKLLGTISIVDLGFHACDPWQLPP